ncbi:MAG: hypothetical protein ACI3V3_08080 [Faecousia sp.]
MNLFRKQLQHTPVFTALLALLLAAAIAFCAIGFAAWSGARAQLMQVDGQYTTIAVPRGDMYWTGLLYEEGQLTPLTQQTERNYPGLLADDRRGFLTAHVSGCDSLSAYERNHYGSADFDTYGNSMAVIAVRCSSVTEMDSSIEQAIFNEKNEIVGYETVSERSYYASFSLETVVSRLPAYDDVLPEAAEITLGSSLFTADGQLPFETGKTYLLFGTYEGPYAEQNVQSGEGEAVWNFPYPGKHRFTIDGNRDSGTSYNSSSGNMLFSWEQIKEGESVYLCLTEDSLPFYAEYTGQLQDFLNSDAGAVWQKEIIPMCQINYESAGVILTDDLNSLFLFNTGEASILEGRGFEVAEYVGGEKVCLISAAYALKNNLSVGDTINLELYQAELGYRDNPISPLSENMEPVLVQSPCKPDNRIGVQKDYTIVGIYAAPEFSYGLHSFQADTILIPKASVPNASAYEDITNPLLYSIILKNGGETEFEAYMDSLGYGGVFAYFNQDYNALADTLSVIFSNALRLLLIGCGAFLLAAALFLFLNFRRMGTVARGMRLLGIRAKAVWLDQCKALAILILVSVILGAGLGAALYGVVTAQVLSEAVALHPQALLICVAAQMTVLLLAAAIGAWLVAKRNPMQSGSRGKGL